MLAINGHFPVRVKNIRLCSIEGNDVTFRGAVVFFCGLHLVKYNFISGNASIIHALLFQIRSYLILVSSAID